MCLSVKHQALAAGRARRALAQVPLLLHNGATLSAAAAGPVQVTVLHESAGMVELGVCSLPALEKGTILDHEPKGECLCVMQQVAVRNGLACAFLQQFPSSTRIVEVWTHANAGCGDRVYCRRADQ